MIYFFFWPACWMHQCLCKHVKKDASEIHLKLTLRHGKPDRKCVYIRDNESLKWQPDLCPVKHVKSQLYMGYIAPMILADNSNFMEDSYCCNSINDQQVATNFCTCHDSTAVMACAKICSNHFIRNYISTKWKFHQIWIVAEKSRLKWSLGLRA